MSLIDLEPTLMPTPRKARPTSVAVTRGEVDVHYKLAATLRDIRIEQGVSQADLATLLGVGQTYVSKVERGEKKMGGAGPNTFFEGIGINYLRRFSKAMNVPLEAVLARAGLITPLGDDGLRGHIRLVMPPSPTRDAMEALLGSWEREQLDELERMRKP